MATSLMKKLTLIAPESESNKLIRRLMWLKCVQINTETKEEVGLDRAYDDDEKNELQRQCNSLSNAIGILGKYSSSKRSLFSGRIPVNRNRFDGDIDTALKIAYKTQSASAKISDLAAQNNKVSIDIASLDPWMAYDAPLDLTSTQSVNISFGTLPVSLDIDEVKANAGNEVNGEFDIDVISEDTHSHYCAVYEHKDCGSRLQRYLTSIGWQKNDFRDFSGTPSEILKKLEEEKSSIDARKADLISELKDYSQSIGELEIAYDIAKTNLSYADAKTKLLGTQSTVYMNGWVPQGNVEKVESVLDSLGCWYEIEEPGEGDTPPVLLQNNKWAKSFEGVVGMYSLPAYGTFDPTFIMSIFYFIIFGLMFADVAYGLILTFGCLFALKVIKPQGGAKQLMQMFMICGISCAISGVLFGSYFGDLIDKIASEMFHSSFTMPRLLDPTKDPMSFLILSLAMGVVHLVTGMVIKMYILFKNHEPVAAICDVGSWLLLFAGIGILLIKPEIGKWVALAGALMIVFTSGRAEKNPIMKFLKGLLGLYGIVNYISDLLSYSRIMALGLASAVIASVVNQIGVMGGVVGIIVALLIGHTLNIAINMLGTYVHTSRLQYIEFFGKFFEDGGVPFTPLEPEIKYTEIADEKAA